MRYFGKITEDKDVITREFLEKGQYDDGVITVAKLSANAKYWDEAPRTVEDGSSFITYDWGIYSIGLGEQIKHILLLLIFSIIILIHFGRQLFLLMIRQRLLSQMCL